MQMCDWLHGAKWFPGPKQNLTTHFWLQKSACRVETAKEKQCFNHDRPTHSHSPATCVKTMSTFYSMPFYVLNMENSPIQVKIVKIT